QKKQADSGETSFLESRLQPDSFFGATGGQRIDTREATGNSSSSMTYSLSQLDAIGDVDPVAEADVYLAYGRDLQAEEILKEAMRSDPGRLAVRTKLLEVYAKRRDTKGYELLATQLYSMTRGEGEDWQKAQQLGQQIDPENPLYQPGGSPSPANASSSTMNEPLGASTMPQSVLPAMGFATTSPSLDADLPPISSLELDLDLDQPTQPGDLSPMSMEATRPIGLVPSAGRDDNSLDFDLPTTAPRSEYADPSASVNTAPMDLDLDSLSLDLDLPPEPPAVDRRSTTPADLEFDLGELEDFGGAGVADTATADLRDGGDDPLQRKFELADEFRQIGDVEGARDLLEEVVAKASGPLKARAQNLLDNLE
ncbi:MAG: FimV/HubP family polar landmark protein, partial [Aquincola tertiaricarbonis]